jgi:acyl carrier protein
MTETEARGKIRAYVVENFLYTRPDFPFGDEESLLRKGIVDSLGVMEVIGFVEDTWGVSVAQEDITEANFGTVAGIARYVAGRAVAAT